MATTVAAIADKAFDAVAAKITGVIQTFTITRTAQGAYDASAGTYTTTVTTDTGRALNDTGSFEPNAALRDLFPDYVAGPGETMFWLEGLDTIVPKEGDKLTIDGTDRDIIRVGDIVGAGGLYAVIAR